MAEKRFGWVDGSKVYHEIQDLSWRQRTSRSMYDVSVCGTVFFWDSTLVGPTPPPGRRLCKQCARARD